MVLPPLTKTAVLLMRFTPKATQGVIATVIEALTQGGIIVVESEGLYDDEGKVIPRGGGDADSAAPVVLGLTTTEAALRLEAELTELVKPCRTPLQHMPTVMERFSSSTPEDFVDRARRADGGDGDDCDEDGLFTSAERALLVELLLGALPAPAALEPDDAPKGGGDEGHTTTLCEVLRQRDYIDAVAPVHIPHIQKKILKDACRIWRAPPLQAIRDYYGEGVAFYFAWMHFMTRWFLFPGLFGLVVYALRKHRGDTVDTCDLTPFVGLVTFAWAVLCNWFWERHEVELAYKWGTYAMADGDQHNQVKRPNFKGKMRRSPITGQMERHFPTSQRLVRYAASAIITLHLLVATGFIMVVSMNMQGYISQSDQELWGEAEHPLYFPFFASLAEEGAIFDAGHAYKSFIPILLRAGVLIVINQRYSRFAETLTEWENHQTVQAHRNSVILKRVLFEAFDAYVILFYLTVYERDVAMLRLELIGCFNMDTLRRVFVECVLPFVIKYFAKDLDGTSKKDDDQKKKGHLTAEAELEEYDSFDDYIEMVIQFGYVTLFASAYPLAAFCAIFATVVEFRSDLWKLTKLSRRMTPVRANDIGMWKLSLVAIAWLSATTNLIIFAFTSSQLRQWLPDYYITDAAGQSMPKTSADTHEIFLVVLVIEHCLIILSMLARNAVPRIPGGVRIEVQKRLWYNERLIRSRHATDARNRERHGSAEVKSSSS